MAIHYKENAENQQIIFCFNLPVSVKAIGEEELQSLLSGFSSPLNEEVEDFVHNKSIEFAKKKLSITYLVIRRTDGGENVLAGIFTLAHKAVEVTNTNISNTARRKLERYARLLDILPIKCLDIE